MRATLKSQMADAVWYLDSWSTELWLLAILLFGVGDVVTTAVGLAGGHLVEVGPLAAPVIDHFGLAALAGLKLAAFAVCVALWRNSRRPSAVGVPLGLVTLGVLVTAWNVMHLLFVP